MSGLSRWMPKSCSRLGIFICYAHEDRALAEEIAQALTNDGHDVFIDASKLKVSGDFNEDIRNAIECADRFIFLISRASMTAGKYPQTELGFAQRRWPSPEGAVWPVLVDADIDVAKLPVYLRSVQIYRAKGNVPAEIAAEIEQSRRVRPRCLFGAAAASVLLIGAAGTYWSDFFVAPNYEFVAAQQVDFRPSRRPGPDPDWVNSWLALTVIPVQYSNNGGAQIRILDETVSLKLAERTVTFKWFNEVELKPICGAPDYLCTKAPVGVATVPPKSTYRRETMFAPAAGVKLTWSEFVEFACASKDDAMEITVSARIAAAGGAASSAQALKTTCRVDAKDMRERLLGCSRGTALTMPRVSPKCLNS